MEIFAEASNVNGGYLVLDGGEFGRKMRGRMVRLPPKRGAIKKQMFDDIAQSLAELFRILTTRGARLCKQRFYQIMAIASLHLCRKANSNTSSWAESVKKLLNVDIQNQEAIVYGLMGSKPKS